MMEVVNWLDLSHTLVSYISFQAARISIRIPLVMKLVFQLSKNLRKTIVKWTEYFLDHLHLLFQHSCEAVLCSGKTTDLGTKKLT